MSEANQPTILVIVGISGDLSKRYLLPALVNIAAAGQLSDKFKLIGVSRRDLKPDEILGSLKDRKLPKTGLDFLAEHLEMFTMDLSAQGDYQQLCDYLDSAAEELGGSAQKLFYLSVPPQVSGGIIENLGKTNLAATGNKLLLEKPFGTDLESAKVLVEDIKQHFTEDQVYRIDHYLAKEVAQNILVFRSDNSLFKHTWSKDFVESIEVIASEKIGIEGRAAFYEQTGALRDFQSHLVQLLALILMEVPSGEDWASVPSMRLKALQQLTPVQPSQFWRGQYEGYRDEVKNPGSMTETFVAMELTSQDPNWAGVPITLTSGKSLDAKTTEVKIRYRPEGTHEANELSFRIQPDEGIGVCLWIKRPGYERKVEQVRLDFSYADYYDLLPEAYEQVLLDAVNSNHALFASSDEVLEGWRLVEPIQRAWSMDDKDLVIYKTGSTVAEVLELAKKTSS